MQDNHRRPGSRVASSGPRAVELTFALDDEDSPTEVTVSPRHRVDNTTAWITMDVDCVVDLEDHV